MASLDLKRIIEKSKSFYGSSNVSDKEFLGEDLFLTVWNCKEYLIEDVGTEFIVETLRNGNDISENDKVRIFDKVLNTWMERIENKLNERNAENG